MKQVSFSLVVAGIGVTSPCASDAVVPMNDIRIVMKTSKGDIKRTLFPAKAPLTVANLLNLSKSGYYHGLKFHRVIPNFMI